MITFSDFLAKWHINTGQGFYQRVSGFVSSGGPGLLCRNRFDTSGTPSRVFAL